MKKNAPGCKCCCSQVLGFDIIDGWDDSPFFTWTPGVLAAVTCCDPGYPYVDDLANTNSDRLNECDVIFCGGWGCVSAARVLFPEEMWSDVGDWVQAGGRLYVAAEYVGLDGNVGCARQIDIDVNNNFLAAIGSSMTFRGNSYCDSGAGCEVAYGVKQGDYPILEGTLGLRHAATGAVDGGTSLLKIEIPEDVHPALECDEVEPYSFCSIEQVGQGYVLCVGDYNALGGCNVDANWDPENCLFWNNWIRKGTLL